MSYISGPSIPDLQPPRLRQRPLYDCRGTKGQILVYLARIACINAHAHSYLRAAPLKWVW
jgi:hypothetical protein